MEKDTTHRDSIGETAYHEAGHIVIALALGFVPTSATIVATEDYQGRVSEPPLLGYTFDGKRGYRRMLRERATVLYAGGEAARHLYSKHEPSGIGDDEDQAFDVMREYPIRGCRAVGDDVYLQYLEKMRRAARRMVARHWLQIQHLAALLLERKLLTAEEIQGWWSHETSDA